MNRPIRAMSILLLLMFAALMINVTWLQYVQAGSLNSLSQHPDNARVRDSEYSQERGAILVRGKAIAESVKSHDRYLYQRVYPQGRMYADITGYYSRDYGLGGIEATQNDILSGSHAQLFVNRVLDLFGNNQPKGGNVALTVNPRAQRAAYDGLRALGAHTRGAVVALEPATGKVLAMATSPTYDPNVLASHDFTKAAKAKQRLLSNPLRPLENRGIQEALPPGSSFKTVTSSAALSNGFTPNSQVPGGTSLPLPLTSTVLHNENGISCGGSKISLTTALDVSCNVAFGWLGLHLGAGKLQQQADAYGFGERYFTDLDDALTRQSISSFNQGAKLDQPQTALSAIGQFNVVATPLQMAEVVSTIANNGTAMKPYIVDETQAPDLSVLDKFDPQPLRTGVISPTVSRELTQMMVSVVDHGTGTAAQIPGVAVAGKTGTAQSAPNRPPYAWFVSFAPADNPQVAVAVLVQDAGVARDAISGNGLAAPIAKSVMEAVIK